MIVLDTNVISEIFRPEPDLRVVAWIEGLQDDVAITSVTLAELLAGVARLPDGKRRSTLAARINMALEPYRDTRAILPFDESAAEQYAAVLVARERDGRPIHTADAQIAAICRANGAICATRNTSDFEGTGIELINPWAA
ncbi:type II toxin-antitoxin system VapC family toxin [Gulosibacter chungangensis]|uniref:Ribonuclease VapC n=1 Tax=Gulosibacter chungangensis TaxID=979746 RepID=A0A7J5B8Q1_9MICO|nr:type II toxin-antitoxin system VapC family toxin [Gulosibacter chungangensis]KAB1641694.1 type II toxin-antitoxin system VapC family toxin [Gulosibacter chungangensis]